MMSKLSYCKFTSRHKQSQRSSILNKKAFFEKNCKIFICGDCLTSCFKENQNMVSQGEVKLYCGCFIKQTDILQFVQWGIKSSIKTINLIPKESRSRSRLQSKNKKRPFENIGFKTTKMAIWQKGKKPASVHLVSKKKEIIEIQQYDGEMKKRIEQKIEQSNMKGLIQQNQQDTNYREQSCKDDSRLDQEFYPPSQQKLSIDMAESEDVIFIKCFICQYSLSREDLYSKQECQEIIKSNDQLLCLNCILFAHITKIKQIYYHNKLNQPFDEFTNSPLKRQKKLRQIRINSQHQFNPLMSAFNIKNIQPTSQSNIFHQNQVKSKAIGEIKRKRQFIDLTETLHNSHNAKDFFDMKVQEIKLKAIK